MIKTKEWLIEARNKASLSQQQLAEKCGVSAPTIAKIEQGQRVGSTETWGKIFEVLSDIDEQQENFILTNEQTNELFKHGQTIAKKLSQADIKIWSKKLLDAEKTNNFDKFMHTYISLLVETNTGSCIEILDVITNKENVKTAAEAILLGMASKSKKINGGKENEK